MGLALDALMLATAVSDVMLSPWKYIRLLELRVQS